MPPKKNFKSRNKRTFIASDEETRDLNNPSKRIISNSTFEPESISLATRSLINFNLHDILF